MKRLDQIVLIGTFLGFSWLAMQAVHELGHVLGGLGAAKGRVSRRAASVSLSLLVAVAGIEMLVGSGYPVHW